MKFSYQVSSPVLRGVEFKYQEDEILANSLTSTNFHTYYQGSEMIIAGKLASDQPYSLQGITVAHTIPVCLFFNHIYLFLFATLLTPAILWISFFIFVKNTV